MATDVEQSRAARFFARLDRQLAVLADTSARSGFLERQLAGWEHRYARFVATEGASEPVCDPADPPQAGDFLVTIAGLAARRTALAARLVTPTTEKENMQFQKEQSGNPAGRPPGSRSKATMLLENLFEGEAEAIARKVIDMAKAGDMAAIRVCMDRLAPARKSAPITCELLPLENRADTAAALSTIIAAVSTGDLTPAEAASLAKVIDSHHLHHSIAEYEQRQAAKKTDK